MANFLLTELIKLHELLETLLSNSSPEFYRSAEMIHSALNRAILLAEFLADGQGSANADVNPDGNRRDSSRKRNRLPSWKKQVKVLPGSNMDLPPEDGFIWRKYGHKEILNSAYPRCYYRCTFKFSHSCPATKKAQRFDKDPTVFNIEYNGTHVCGQRAISAPPAPRSSSIDGGVALNVMTQGLVGSPSFSSCPSPVSRRWNEIVLSESHRENSAPQFVSFSGADAAHITPDESFHGSNNFGAWEHDEGNMLCAATYAIGTDSVDHGTFLEDDSGQSFLRDLF